MEILLTGWGTLGERQRRASSGEIKEEAGKTVRMKTTEASDLEM